MFDVEKCTCQIDEAENAPWMAPALGGQLDGFAVKAFPVADFIRDPEAFSAASQIFSGALDKAASSRRTCMMNLIIYPTDFCL